MQNSRPTSTLVFFFFLFLTIQLFAYYVPCSRNPGLKDVAPQFADTYILREHTPREHYHYRRWQVGASQGLRTQWRGWLILITGLDRHSGALKDDQKLPMVGKKGDFPLIVLPPCNYTAPSPSSAPYKTLFLYHAKVTVSLWNSTALAVWFTQFGTHNKWHLTYFPP